MNIKQQREEAREILIKDPMTAVLVTTITRTGSRKAAVVVVMVVDRWGTNPTIEQWQQARELSEVFKVRNAKRGRPSKDWTNEQVGQLSVIEPTGYVNIETGDESALWLCTCMCDQNKEFTLTAHQLQRKLNAKYEPCCGPACPRAGSDNKKRNTNWKKAVHQPTPEPPKPAISRLNQLVDAMPDDNHTPLGSNSTKIH